MPLHRLQSKATIEDMDVRHRPDSTVPHVSSGHVLKLSEQRKSRPAIILVLVEQLSFSELGGCLAAWSTESRHSDIATEGPLLAGSRP
jgi:hypothetical protein